MSEDKINYFAPPIRIDPQVIKFSGLLDKFQWGKPRRHERIYWPGRKIRSMNALDKWLDQGNYVFWGTRPRALHPGFFISMQYRVVREAIKRGSVRKAIGIVRYD